MLKINLSESPNAVKGDPKAKDENWEGGPEIDEEKMRSKKKRKRSGKVRLDSNLYEAIGFEEWGEDFSTKLLKKKYMKLALKFHPDKLGKQYDELAKKKWLTVSKFDIIITNMNISNIVINIFCRFCVCLCN